MNLAVQVRRALERAVGVPVVGMTIRDPADRTTWQAQYLATVTPEQRAAGDQFLQTYDPQTDALAARQERAEVLRDPAFVTALLRWLAPKYGRTAVALYTEVRALLDQPDGEL